MVSTKAQLSWFWDNNKAKLWRYRAYQTKVGLWSRQNLFSGLLLISALCTVQKLKLDISCSDNLQKCNPEMVSWLLVSMHINWQCFCFPATVCKKILLKIWNNSWNKCGVWFPSKYANSRGNVTIYIPYNLGGNISFVT